MARNFSLASLLDLSKPGAIWRILAIVFAILNLKSLPFVWHVSLRAVPPQYWPLS